MDFPLFAFVPFSAAALAFLLRLFFALLLKACPFAPLGESNSKLFRLFAMVVVSISAHRHRFSYLKAASPQILAWSPQCRTWRPGDPRFELQTVPLSVGCRGEGIA